MLQRLANVIFYGCLLVSAILILVGVFSFSLGSLFICFLSAFFLGSIGWTVRYVLTGEKYPHPMLIEIAHKWWSNPKIKTLISRLLVKDDWTESPAHPWRRYFARMLDISIYGLLFFPCLVLFSVW